MFCIYLCVLYDDNIFLKFLKKKYEFYLCEFLLDIWIEN